MEDQIQKFLNAVGDMRKKQNAYFKENNPGLKNRLLIDAKIEEEKVDKMLVELKTNRTQGNLF